MAVDPRGRAARGRVLRFGIACSVIAELILCEATRGFDRANLVKVEINDGLERLAGGGVAERFGQGVEPLDVFGLQSDELGHNVMPSLPPAATIGGLAVADDGSAGMTFSVARLSFGTAEGLAALRLGSPGHGCHSPVT